MHSQPKNNIQADENIPVETKKQHESFSKFWGAAKLRQINAKHAEKEKSEDRTCPNVDHKGVNCETEAGEHASWVNPSRGQQRIVILKFLLE